MLCRLQELDDQHQECRYDTSRFKPFTKHQELVYLVSNVTKNNGLMICGEVSSSILNENEDKEKQDKIRQEKKAASMTWLRKNKIKAFHCVCKGELFLYVLFCVTSLVKCNDNARILKFYIEN